MKTEAETQNSNGDLINRQDAIPSARPSCSENPNRSDDLISRADAIEVAYQLRRKPNDDEWDWWLRSFNAIPSAEPKRGKWKKISPAGIYKCSQCGKTVMTGYIEEYDFCHGCGADMRKGEER